jgi:ribose-phosphate pyrophosphokinase
MAGRLQIFSGNANLSLAQEVASCLNMSLGRAIVGTFENGETRVKLEDNVRGCDVFVIQPTCTPVNQNLVEMLMLIDALRRASVARVTAVIPYYGYAKQEKKTAGREPIAARLVADMLRAAGTDRVLAMDLHAPAIEGFFDIPVDHLQAAPLLADHTCRIERANTNAVIVSPDAGGVARANQFREHINNSGLAIIASHRVGSGLSKAMEMVGEVEGKTAIVIDDMISTGRTLVDATRVLLERGASEVYACATHGVFASKAFERISQTDVSGVIVTNTIPQQQTSDKIQSISVAPLFAEAIMRIHKDLSLSVLFS